MKSVPTRIVGHLLVQCVHRSDCTADTEKHVLATFEKGGGVLPRLPMGTRCLLLQCYCHVRKDKMPEMNISKVQGIWLIFMVMAVN